MKLEVEMKSPILAPNETQVRNAIARLKSFGPNSFASLSDVHGNYLQVAGGGITCMLERRDAATGRHFRGFKLEKNSNYPDGTRLVFGAGEIALQSDEWFNHTEIAEVFTAFLGGNELPPFINWRDVSDILSSRSR
ncbi:hypothetical protein [Duganella sp. Root336D2]|nr:hypothetical protein [Duganella sp. Root336D2]